MDLTQLIANLGPEERQKIFKDMRTFEINKEINSRLSQDKKKELAHRYINDMAINPLNNGFAQKRLRITSNDNIVFQDINFNEGLETLYNNAGLGLYDPTAKLFVYFRGSLINHGMIELILELELEDGTVDEVQYILTPSQARIFVNIAIDSRYKLIEE